MQKAIADQRIEEHPDTVLRGIGTGKFLSTDLYRAVAVSSLPDKETRSKGPRSKDLKIKGPRSIRLDRYEDRRGKKIRPRQLLILVAEPIEEEGMKKALLPGSVSRSS